MTYGPLERANAAADAIRPQLARTPRIALILGSGLGALANEVEESHSLPYAEIPHFPLATAPGHTGRLVLGTLEGIPVAIMAGRHHMYEGYSAEDVAHGVRVLRLLGAETLLITNAAGGINLAFHPGTLMLISDHLNLTGRSPLIGPPIPEFGVRFPDMTDAYSARLRSIARRVASDLGIDLPEGVYLGLVGPSYETPAEIRMARVLGADAVGMSTVMESIAANHFGMEVLGISCITNMAAGILPQKLTEEEVIATATLAREEFSRLVRGIVAAWRPPIDEELR